MTLVLLWIGLAVAGPEMIPEEDLDLVGRTAPEIELPLLGGGEFDLDAHRGRPVAISFWASWCGPCRQELPDLQALAARRGDFDVVAVNVDRREQDARRFLAKTPVDIPIALDSEARVMGTYQIASMPTLVLVDANGTVKLVKSGYSRARGFPELEAALSEVRR